MTIKKNIALSETGFVFDPSSGNSFSTNPIGLEIIQQMKKNKTQEEIEAHVLELYEVDKTTFEKDYYDFVNMLVKLKLTESDEKD
jgi:hypothetical protein